MVHEFKKTGVAAALTGALLATASMNSQAVVQLSVPGDVVLVPYVVCETAKTAKKVKNTLVGLTTFYKERLGLYSYYNASGTIDGVVSGGTKFYFPAPDAFALSGFASSLLTFKPQLPARNTARPSSTGTVHWYFYDSRSVHKLDGVIPVTDNDFVRFDWCSTLNELSQTDALSGTEGYLIFTSDELDVTSTGTGVVPRFALYGHSYQIVGNWASQAFIPVIPNPVFTAGTGDTGYWPTAAYPGSWNMQKRSGYPAFRRLVSGTDFTDTAASGVSTAQRDIYMRYFLDPALATENKMVFWFNSNYDAGSVVINGNTVTTPGRTVAGETYDSEQVYKASFSDYFPNELTVVTSTPTDPAYPGMLHSEVETYGSKATVINTGLIRFGITEYTSNISWTSSGVSFNMLGLGAGDNDAQFQTEMATEAEVYAP